MDIRTLIGFLNAVEPMKYNTRHSWTSRGRQESVAEHSWRLALMAYLVKDEFPEADISRTILMCLCHDLGEAVTGDIPSFEKSDRDEKIEEKAVEDLLKLLPQTYEEELAGLFHEMKEGKTMEARIYKALDSMECIIQHNQAPLSTWLPLEHELNLVYGKENTAFSPYMEELQRAVNEDTREKLRAGK